MANRPDKMSIDTTAIRAIREWERQRDTERKRESSKQRICAKTSYKQKKNYNNI
jgi:hypothetical protein